jgi:hypothetical protein
MLAMKKKLSVFSFIHSLKKNISVHTIVLKLCMIKVKKLKLSQYAFSYIIILLLPFCFLMSINATTDKKKSFMILQVKFFAFHRPEKYSGHIIHSVDQKGGEPIARI